MTSPVSASTWRRISLPHNEQQQGPRLTRASEDMESLRSKLEQLKERIEGGMSAQFLKIMHSATRELEQSGIAQRVLNAGADAPMFELDDQHGNLRKAEDLVSQGPLVLTFYRGFW